MAKSKLIKVCECDCDMRVDTEINSMALWKELKNFFEVEKESGRFLEIPVKKPYYIGYGEMTGRMEWYADYWYKCKYCNTVWEFRNPDFPAKGFVGRLEGRVHKSRMARENGKVN